MTMKEALQLTVKVLSKTLDSTTLKPEKLEFVVLTRGAVEGGKMKPKVVVMNPKQIEELLKSCDLKNDD